MTSPTNEHRESETAQLQKRLQVLEEEYRLKQASWETCAQLAEIGQLTTGVMHELKNPLTVILGFAQRLQRHALQNPDLSESINSIEREAIRCNRLVQDILNFSHHAQPHKTKENLYHVLDNALALVFPLARLRNVQIRHGLRPPLPDIYIDRHRIQQVIINLCTNALDATSQGGWLTLEAHPYGKNNEIEIIVRDSGKGIAPEILESIFDPFFTTKERGKGTGLGLSIVKEIIDEHQGRIQVLSPAGQGTIVSVILPLGTPATNLEPNPKLE